MNFLGRTSIKIFMIVLLIASGCLEPYQPSIIENSPDYLVVNAFMSSTTNTATVRLLRTVSISSKETTPFESKARVTVEDNDGLAYLLVETGNGSYVKTGLVLNFQKKYRLRIILSQGQEYISDFVQLLDTPPIDDVFYIAKEDGIQIYLNTHDAGSKTRYYKWDYDETWEYTSKYPAAYKLVNGVVVGKRTTEENSKCWKTVPSTKVLVTTTDRLTSDVVNAFPMIFIPRGSIKISRKYSVLVSQQTLSEEAYGYWLNIQKTTEQLGGLFDPLPSQIFGNIHRIDDPSEPVIGYFGGGATSEKRIFIDSRELPNGFSNHTWSNCTVDTVLFANIPDLSSLNLPDVVQPHYSPSGTEPIGYLVSSLACVDCRVAGGGVVTRPDFWQ